MVSEALAVELVAMRLSRVVQFVAVRLGLYWSRYVWPLAALHLNVSMPLVWVRVWNTGGAGERLTRYTVPLPFVPPDCDVP